MRHHRRCKTQLSPVGRSGGITHASLIDSCPTDALQRIYLACLGLPMNPPRKASGAGSKKGENGVAATVLTTADGGAMASYTGGSEFRRVLRMLTLTMRRMSGMVLWRRKSLTLHMVVPTLKAMRVKQPTGAYRDAFCAEALSVASEVLEKKFPILRGLPQSERFLYFDVLGKTTAGVDMARFWGQVNAKLQALLSNLPNPPFCASERSTDTRLTIHKIILYQHAWAAFQSRIEQSIFLALARYFGWPRSDLLVSFQDGFYINMVDVCNLRVCGAEMTIAAPRKTRLMQGGDSGGVTDVKLCNNPFPSTRSALIIESIKRGHSDDHSDTKLLPFINIASYFASATATV